MPPAAHSPLTMSRSENPATARSSAWASAASNHDFTAVTSPACVVKLGIPVELGGQLQRSRGDGVWGTSGTLKAKANHHPGREGNRFGLGISGGTSWDLVTGAIPAASSTSRSPFRCADRFPHQRQRRLAARRCRATSTTRPGARASSGISSKPVTLIARSLSGIAGELPGGEEDEAPSPNSIREPRTQIGIALHAARQCRHRRDLRSQHHGRECPLDARSASTCAFNGDA